MSIRYVENLSRYVEIGESFVLPSKIVATRENGNQVLVGVNWSPNRVDTSVKGEYLFIGTVPNYASKVLLSLEVGYGHINKPSVFPDQIDFFDDTKEDILASQVEDYDEFQFLKAKVPRMEEDVDRITELRDKLNNNIVWAKDINHIRNCLVAIEEYLLTLEEGWEDRLDEIEADIEIIKKDLNEIEKDIEEIKYTIETVGELAIRDIQNLCSEGVNIVSKTEGGTIYFKGITGSGVDISTSGGCLVISD